MTDQVERAAEAVIDAARARMNKTGETEERAIAETMLRQCVREARERFARVELKIEKVESLRAALERAQEQAHAEGEALSAVADMAEEWGREVARLRSETAWNPREVTDDELRDRFPEREAGGF